jgi:hypothetical protein
LVMAPPVYDAVLCFAGRCFAGRCFAGRCFAGRCFAGRAIRLAVAESGGVEDGCLAAHRPCLEHAVADNEEDGDDEPSDAPGRGRGNLATWQHEQQRVEEGRAEPICSLRERVRKIGGRLSRVSRVRQAILGDEHNQYRGSDCRDVSERAHGKVAADKAQQYRHEYECAPHNPYDPRIHAAPPSQPW